ncbi:MAG: hypothetical protein IPL61_26280 [Myxococcales bacterium]|nr:hypothetical protein [Myxococcales bacterium]
MRAPIRVVCRRPAALGLGLAGLACTEAPDGATAAAAIATIEAAGGAVILIERALYDELPGALRRQVERDGAPLLMPFPGPTLDATGAAPEQELLDLLRRSVGYRVRLR